MSAPAPRLVVEVPWGPQAGRKVAVPPGDRLRVGRSDRAELCVPTDADLSALHFELTWDGAACQLRDLGKSKQAVKVDGVAVTAADLAHGAWIRAGSTDFRVWVEGAPRPALPAAAEEEPADDVAYAARELARVERENEQALRARVAAVLTELSRVEHLHAILDATRSPRVRELLSASPDQARSLYEGAQGEAMADIAPWLVRFAPGSPLVERLVVEGWGARWGVFLTSAQPFKELRRHLRRFLMVTDEETGESLYFRFYDPEVLRTFLPTCAVRQAEELWGDIDAFLFEGEGGGLERHDRATALSTAKERVA
jgi:Domain of unknown function (DUF4123)/Inner membrane component of T3SS, cytoplasmic domain